MESTAPFGCPQYTGDPTISASDEFIFAEMPLQTSSSNTQAPGLSLHVLQAMHPRMGLLPIQTISLSMPSFSNCFAISAKAMEVLPFWRGLPFIIKTFILLISIKNSLSPHLSRSGISLCRGQHACIRPWRKGASLLPSRLHGG